MPPYGRRKYWLPSSLKRNDVLWVFCFLLLIFFLAFVIGLFTDLGSLIMWDDEAQLEISWGILGRYGLMANAPIIMGRDYYYGPLWELFLGIMEHLVFPFLHDPLLVRHALNFALFPFTLAATFFLLRRAGVSKATSTVSIACLFGIIRLGGHSLFNVKDFPAAVAYLLVSLSIWVVLQESSQKGYRDRYLVCAGALSVIPFLLRVPLILHFVLLLCVLGFVAMVTNKSRLGFWKRVTMPIVAFLAGLMTTVLFYPPFWTTNFTDWLNPFTLFTKFYSWDDHFYIFGERIYSFAVPWWYSFAWIPAIVHPVVALFCAIGIFALLLNWVFPQQIGHTFFVRKQKKLNISLIRWLSLILILSFAAIIIEKPILYDEERHLLFLYPTFFLLASLGLDWLRPRTKYVLAGTIIIVSIFSYIQWGKYSYVYKSPLIRDRHANQFMGDYWAICLGDAVKALKGRVPHEYPVAEDVRHMALLQEKRLNESLLYRDPDFGHYEHLYTYDEATPDSLSQGNLAMIEYNSRKDSRRDPYGFMDYTHRSPKVLWKETMPPLDDTACVLILFKEQKTE